MASIIYVAATNNSILTPESQPVSFSLAANSNTVSISWTVKGNDNPLDRVEIWRAPDVGGVPGTWSEVLALRQTMTRPDIYLHSGSVIDSPGNGDWWYGLHVIDTNVLIGYESTSLYAKVNETVDIEPPSGGGMGDIPPEELPPELWPDFEWVDPYPGGWETIDVTTQGVTPDDGNNDVPAINNILDGLTGPTILYFPEGTYTFSSGSVDKHDDVIYKGDGPDKTTFMLENDAGGLRWSGWWYDSTTVNADVPAYSRNIPIADTSSLLVGDFVRIYQQYDAGEGLKNTWGGVFEIVDVGSSSITIDTPIGLPLTAFENPTVQEIRMIKNVGVEGIKFIRTSSGGGSTIIFSRTHNAYVDNIESYDTAKHHVAITWGHNIVVKNSYFDGSQYGGPGGFGYGIFAESLSTKIKAENNIMKDLRHQSVVQTGANNYIYAYNFHYDTPREICWYDIPTPSWCGSAQQIRDMWNSWREIDVAGHGNFPHNNLWEGNVLYVPGMDDSHGDNGPINTFFRNKAFGQPNSYSWIEGVGIFRDRENEDHTIIGNMLYNDSILWIRNPVGDEQAFIGANLEQGEILWGNLPVNAQLPASLYRTSPPSWWDGSEWPPFGPDVANSETNKIPAEARWDNMQ